jgi:hypothetical protein
MYCAASNRQKQRTSASAGAQVVHGASGLLHHAKPRAEVADRRHAEQRLGIAAEIKPKTKLSTLATLYASVASGEVEIAFNPVSEIWLNQPSNSLHRCHQLFRTTPSSPGASLPAAVRLTPQERWSRSFTRLRPRPF